MLLNHSVKAAISRPVALFTTAAGTLPTAASPVEAKPEAAEEETAASNEADAESAAVALVPVRGPAALRETHSCNCLLEGGVDTETCAPGNKPIAAARQGCMVQCCGWTAGCGAAKRTMQVADVGGEEDAVGAFALKSGRTTTSWKLKEKKRDRSIGGRSIASVKLTSSRLSNAPVAVIMVHVQPQRGYTGISRDTKHGGDRKRGGSGGCLRGRDGEG
jgi:hypothetical protein